MSSLPNINCVRKRTLPLQHILRYANRVMDKKGYKKMRTWNPLWMNLFEVDDILDYKEGIMNMVMASVNWVERYPGVELNWEENDKRVIMNTLEIPQDIDEDEVILYGDWNTFFYPTTCESHDFFDSIIKSCGENVPTISMMEKAINAGFLVWKEGWDYFNVFMLGTPDTDKLN